MPLAVPAAPAREWAAFTVAVRREVAAAVARGQLATDLAPPPDISSVLTSLLAEIDAAPTTADDVELATADSPSFASFAHYVRAVQVWLDELADRGIVNSRLGPAGREFQRHYIEPAVPGH